MTDNQKNRVYGLISDGLDTATIVRRMRGAVTPQQVAACRAHATMNSTPKVFEVQGTIIVEALDRESAIEAATRQTTTRRPTGTRVLNTSLNASRLSAASASQYLS